MCEAGKPEIILRLLGEPAGVADDQRRGDVAALAVEVSDDAGADRLADRLQRLAQPDREGRRTEIGRLGGAVAEAGGADAAIIGIAGEIITAGEHGAGCRAQPRQHLDALADFRHSLAAHRYGDALGNGGDALGIEAGDTDGEAIAAAPRLALLDPARHRSRHLPVEPARRQRIGPQLDRRRAARRHGEHDQQPDRHRPVPSCEGDGPQEKRKARQRQHGRFRRQREIDQRADAERDRQPGKAPPGLDLPLQPGAGGEPKAVERDDGAKPRRQAGGQKKAPRPS